MSFSSTWPNELLFRIFESLDFLSIVRSRRVCRQWNHVSHEILVKLRIIYCYDSLDDLTSKVSNFDEIAPWLSRDERVAFRRWSLNTAITSDIESLLFFIEKHCPTIEAFIHHGVYLPFVFFAETLGPRMRFFHGHFTYKWTETSTAILSNFEKLEHFPGFNGPCNLILLQHGLPLKCITTKCHGHCECLRSLMAASVEATTNENSLIERKINPSFAHSVKVLNLTRFRDSTSSFCFPNLEYFSASHGIDQDAIVLRSLEDSPRLKSLIFEISEWRALRIVELLIHLMDKLVHLECLEYDMPLRYGRFYHRYEEEDGLYEAIRKLLFCCRKLHRLALPFNLYSELERAVDIFSEFCDLGYFRCREVSEVFVHDMLAHTLHHQPTSKELTIIGALNDNTSITNQLLHDLIESLGEGNTINRLNINFYCSNREHTCHVKRIVPTLGDPMEDQNFINFA